MWPTSGISRVSCPYEGSYLCHPSLQIRGRSVLLRTHIHVDHLWNLKSTLSFRGLALMWPTSEISRAPCPSEHSFPLTLSCGQWPWNVSSVLCRTAMERECCLVEDGHATGVLSCGHLPCGAYALGHISPSEATAPPQGWDEGGLTE
jgi:hypothetical protein